LITHRDKVNIDMDLVRGYDNNPPYLDSVHQLLEKGEPKGVAEVLGFDGNKVEIGTGFMPWIDSVKVPVESIKVVEHSDVERVNEIARYLRKDTSPLGAKEQ